MNLDKIISGELNFTLLDSFLIVGELVYVHSGKCHSELMDKLFAKFTERLDEILKESNCNEFDQLKLNVKTSEVARKIVHEIVELKKTLDGMETL